MSKSQNDAACVKALLDYSQGDEDGVFVFVSRQAIHETAGLVEGQLETIRQLHTELAIAREAVWSETIKVLEIAVRNAFNDGWRQGLKEHTSYAGGKSWIESDTKKYLEATIKDALNPKAAVEGK